MTTTNAATEMTSSSTAPDFRSTKGYNDPPEDIFGNVKGKDKATEDETGDEDANGSNGRRPPKQPRSRRLNNASLSGQNHLRSDSRESSIMGLKEVDGLIETDGRPMNRYPAHSSIPTGSKGPSSANGRISASASHLSESFDRELHAIEHEIQDTLFRGTEADRRSHNLTREESRESQFKYHLDDQSMEMDVTIDEKTLRSMRRSRYLRSAAVTGIFVLLWCVLFAEDQFALPADL